MTAGDGARRLYYQFLNLLVEFKKLYKAGDFSHHVILHHVKILS